VTEKNEDVDNTRRSGTASNIKRVRRRGRAHKLSPPPACPKINSAP